MISKKYYHQIVKIILKRCPPTAERWFIFGSSLRKNHFGDIDVGVIGDIDKMRISDLREDFENSHLPYRVDIIPLSSASRSFRKNVLRSPVQWIKH